MSFLRLPAPVLAAQALLGAGGLALLAFAPPAAGPMTIVSLAGQSGDAIAGWSLGEGATLVARGEHSLTVTGSRAALVPLALRHGALVVAARPGLCGARTPA